MALVISSGGWLIAVRYANKTPTGVKWCGARGKKQHLVSPVVALWELDGNSDNGPNLGVNGVLDLLGNFRGGDRANLCRELVQTISHCLLDQSTI